MDALQPQYGPVHMVPAAPAHVEHVGADELLAAAEELVARLRIMSTASALPGDEAVAWHDHREECIAAVSSIAVGLITMAVPE